MTRHSLLPACKLIVASVTLMIASAAHAFAQGSIEAAYAISIARIPVGTLTMSFVAKETEYSISGSARVTGAVRMLNNGEGSSIAHGAIRDGNLIPSTFESKSTFEGDPPEVKMAFEDGNVVKLDVPPLGQDRVPLTAAHRVGVIDPLSALLMPAPEIIEGLTPQPCQGRTLSIFDGHLRYDLKLRFKRLDKIEAKEGYSGPVLVCGVSLVPIGGHQESNTLLKFFTGREMEAVLAPVTFMRAVMPIRVVVESMLANLVVRATRFETKAQPPASPAAPDFRQ
jgi:Protein of unknown function (DUF3108)